MSNFLLSPILALFSLKFYRQAQTAPVSRGFLYLGYLSFLLALYGMILFRIQWMPAANEFVDWLKQNLPEMTLTRQGLEMKIAEPRLLTHSRWGALIYLDPVKDSPDSADLEKAVVVITRTKVGYRDPSTEELRIQNIVQQSNAANWRDVSFTQETIGRLWRKLSPWLAAIFFLTSFVGFYLWKLIAALLYSLIGMLLNLFRKTKLRYGSILNVCFFALTPLALLQALVWLFPNFPLPVNLLTSLTLTTLYLAFAILASQDRASQPV